VGSATETTVLIAAGKYPGSQLRAALAAAGLVVAAECGTAAEAIESAARLSPDVCVLDRQLPGGALAAAAAITSPRRAPKVLLVGGHGSDAGQRAALLAGASAFLPGEPDGAALAAAVAATQTQPSPTRALPRSRAAREGSP
jgi:DNA-binding NarL/FixJ family response regulator